MSHVRVAAGLVVYAVMATEPLAGQTPAEVETAQQVYAQLARQFHDGKPPPEFELRANCPRVRVACYDADREAIVLETLAFEVARSLGADSLHALAYLLGHELAHFYGDHWQRFNFLDVFRGLAVADTLAARADSIAHRSIRAFQRQESLRFEAEADLKAGFAAYLAGYQPLPVAPNLLTAIYTRYRLAVDVVSAHPPLSDRVQIANIAADKLDGLVQVFEGGVNLMVIGRYEEAARVFDHIARAFPGREILSNAGTARALRALARLGPDVPWAYPFELDVETRLRRDRVGRPGSAIDPEVIRLLREAQELFELARLRDPAYLPAWVNLAGVHQLLGESEFALGYAGRALALAEAQGEAAPRAHALVIRGIVRAEAGDHDAARADFEAAAAASPGFSEANLIALDGDTARRALASGGITPAFGRQEAVAGIAGNATAAVQATVRRMGARPQVSVTLPAAGTASAVGITADRFDNANAFVIGNPANVVVAILATADGYTGSSAAGIRVGSSLEDVREAHGRAGRVIATRQGEYHVYNRAQIAFAVDARQQVTGWLVWHVRE